jgi:hypothetical protein
MLGKKIGLRPEIIQVGTGILSPKKTSAAAPRKPKATSLSARVVIDAGVFACEFVCTVRGASPIRLSSLLAGRRSVAEMVSAPLFENWATTQAN